MAHIDVVQPVWRSVDTTEFTAAEPQPPAPSAGHRRARLAPPPVENALVRRVRCLIETDETNQ